MGEHHRSGGNRWCIRARPLPDVCGGALGEASGTVSFHLREQGRPQGASFSAGDLSLHPRYQSSAEPTGCISLVTRAGRRMHRQRPHRGDAGAHRHARTILRRIRKSDTDFRRLASDDDGSRGPRYLARAPQGPCRDRLRCRLCRARRDVSAMGPGALRGAPRRGPRTLAPAGDDPAGARRRGAAPGRSER